MNQRICRAVQKVRTQIRQSPRPQLPLFWTEWSVPSYGDLNARDNVYVGPALAYDIQQCDGLVDMLSWWTFSDVFEENGVRSQPFDGGFGLMAAGGIKKPSYNAYKLLHLLGTERLANPANALVTRRKDGTLVVALWNLVEMDQLTAGKSRLQTVRFTGVDPKAKVSVLRLDADHGNTEGMYRRIGSPQYPTRAQVEQINREGEIAHAEQKILVSGAVTLEIPVNGLLILELRK